MRAHACGKWVPVWTTPAENFNFMNFILKNNCFDKKIMGAKYLKPIKKSLVRHNKSQIKFHSLVKK